MADAIWYRSNCPHCNKSIKVNDRQFGKRARCPKCKNEFLIEDFASNETSKPLPEAAFEQKRVTESGNQPVGKATPAIKQPEKSKSRKDSESNAQFDEDDRQVENAFSFESEDSDDEWQSTVKKPSDLWAWALVAVPVIGAIAEIVTGYYLWWFYFALNSVFGFIDERKIKSAGFKGPSGGWAAFLVPVYLWKRATLLNVSKKHFYAWIATFVVSLIAMNALEEFLIESEAKNLVTKIMHENRYVNGADLKCLNVRVTGKVSRGIYRGIATLIDGSEIRILIEVSEKNMIVTIPKQRL